MLNDWLNQAIVVGMQEIMDVHEDMEMQRTPPFMVAAFYKFVDLPQYKALQVPLRVICAAHEVKGTVLLASEGVNGTIAGAASGVQTVLAWLSGQEAIGDVPYKTSWSEEPVFHRLKIKLKGEIVALRVPGVDPNERVGTYVEPHAWNTLIQRPDVRVIDTRNSFEVEMGSFEGAENPHTVAFSDFPTYVDAQLSPDADTKVAMFCTGGIRCEKATSYLLQRGFKEVYHLNGGILRYLEEVATGDSLWHGECFVFDNRVSVDHDLKPGAYELCYSCHFPVSPNDRLTDAYEVGVSCPRCHDTLTDEKRASARERQRQIELAEARGEEHIGRIFPEHQPSAS